MLLRRPFATGEEQCSQATATPGAETEAEIPMTLDPPTGPKNEQREAIAAAQRLLVTWEQAGLLLVVERHEAVVRLANVILDLRA